MDSIISHLNTSVNSLHTVLEHLETALDEGEEAGVDLNSVIDISNNIEDMIIEIKEIADEVTEQL